jgi:hypothetical protein
MAAPPRELTAGETLVLKLIQEQFGSKNGATEVFFTDSNDAAIFAKTSDGAPAVMANLTNLAAWRTDGTISSDDELVREWLGISN